MNDFVDELRLPASIDQADTQRRLAADEIERLRGLLREWLDDGIVGPIDLENRTIKALGE